LVPDAATMRFYLPLLAVLLVSVSGCTGSGQSRANTTDKSVATAVLSAKALPAQVDSLVTALGTLQNSRADLKVAYKALADASTVLDRGVTALTRDVKTARSAGSTYARDWDAKLATIQNPEVVATSRARLDQLQAGVERLTIAETDLGTISDSFMTRLKDVRTALDLDLSPGGVSGLRASIGSLIAAAPALKQQADTVSDRLRGIEGFLNDPAPKP
jgi:hypothetical protein